ncbi:hypothetical protein Leryth_025312 [Lithospermum erythrorhizon]|nr:hypothetical protein Leryth_025312 [Lithospermum erythrorhizon]
MGWHIVREGAANEPGMCSRLWLAEDIHHVLTKNTGTSSIEGLRLHLATPEDVNFSNYVFKSMDKLRLLIVHNAFVPNAPGYFPSELKWLDWYGYPSKSLPASFQAENLVCLKMKYSRIIQIWKGVKVVDKLKFINLSHSQKLIRTPDFAGVPNLERLILEDCASLVEIHPSVGLLKRLVLCNLKDCRNLRKLPKSMTLESLEVFILSGCLKLDTFPEIIGSMKCLLEIRMEATAVTELPWSIGNLTNLCLLNLSCCRVLESLPDSLTKMKCLKVLVLSGCSKLNSLPEEIGQMESLEEVHCDETAILQPPSSISLLKNLKSLSFRGCREVNSESWSSHLVSWPFSKKYLNAKKYFNFPSVSGLHSLTKLDLSDCCMLEGGVPNDINCLISLEELNLGMNNFVNMSAASLSGLARLRVLELNGCERLEALPELPSSIAEIYADDCTSLKSSADALIKYKNMYRMSFSNCINFLQDRQDSDISDRLWHHLLKGLSSVDDNFSICLPGAIVPDWFQHQTIGPSISVMLPPNWYNDKFMGFGLCVVSDLLSTSLSRSYNYLKMIPGIRIQFTVTTKDLKRSRYASSICYIGAEKDVDSEHMILAYLPFGQLWVAFHKRVHSPNDWISIEASADDLSKKYFVLKAWGFGLVYEDDVKHIQTDDCSSIIQQSSPDLRKMGLFHASFSGLQYIKEGRNGVNYNFSRLPPEI